MDTQQTLYGYHSDNLREVTRGFNEVVALGLDGLSKDEASAVSALTRICVFLLSAKVEARFYKLLYEPPVPDEFRALVNASPPQRPSLETKWIRTIKHAFALYYDVTGDFLASTAPSAAIAQYQAHLTGLATLVPIFELRNKVAHGQWRHALNGAGTALNPASTSSLDSENLLTLTLKDRLAGAIVDGINDLVVSRRTHDRDLSKHQRRLQNAQRELESRSFDKFAAARRKREERSRILRRSTRES
jgi:hypothetical protein